METHISLLKIRRLKLMEFRIHSYPARSPQQIIRSAIDIFTAKGDIVLDLMVGSGTTLVECEMGKRKEYKRYNKSDPKMRGTPGKK